MKCLQRETRIDLVMDTQYLTAFVPSLISGKVFVKIAQSLDAHAKMAPLSK